MNWPSASAYREWAQTHPLTLHVGRATLAVKSLTMGHFVSAQDPQSRAGRPPPGMHPRRQRPGRYASGCRGASGHRVPRLLAGNDPPPRVRPGLARTALRPATGVAVPGRGAGRRPVCPHAVRSSLGPELAQTSAGGRGVSDRADLCYCLWIPERQGDQSLPALTVVRRRKHTCWRRAWPVAVRGFVLTAGR